MPSAKLPESKFVRALQAYDFTQLGPKAMSLSYLRWMLFTLLLVAPTLAYANAGVPLLGLTWPGMLALLVPIIFVEAYIIKREGISFKVALKGSAIANSVSTIIGMPLATILFAGILEPGEWIINRFALEHLRNNFIFYIIGSAVVIATKISDFVLFGVILLCLLACFWISYFIERVILRFTMKNILRNVVYRACLKANFMSYLLIIAGILILPLVSAVVSKAELHWFVLM